LHLLSSFTDDIGLHRESIGSALPKIPIIRFRWGDGFAATLVRCSLRPVELLAPLTDLTGNFAQPTAAEEMVVSSSWPDRAKRSAGSGTNRRDRPASTVSNPQHKNRTPSIIRSKEKVEIEKYPPTVIAEEISILRVSHIRVDFQRIEMIGQVDHCCGQPNGMFGVDLDVFRGSKIK